MSKLGKYFDLISPKYHTKFDMCSSNRFQMMTDWILIKRLNKLILPIGPNFGGAIETHCVNLTEWDIAHNSLIFNWSRNRFKITQHVIGVSMQTHCVLLKDWTFIFRFGIQVFFIAIKITISILSTKFSKLNYITAMKYDNGKFDLFGDINMHVGNFMKLMLMILWFNTY